MTGQKGMKNFPKALKDEAVRLYLDEHMQQKEIAVQLGVADPQRIKIWVRNYRRNGTPYHQNKKRGRPPKDPNSPPKPGKNPTRDLEREVERLRMENELLKKFHSELRRWSQEK
jgi:transposase-like protein